MILTNQSTVSRPTRVLHSDDRMDQNNDKVVKESIFLTDKYSRSKDSNLSSGVSSDDDGYSTPCSSPPRQTLTFSGLLEK